VRLRQSRDICVHRTGRELSIMSLVDFSQLDTSPLRYQVDQMIPEVGTGFLWGQSWSGKSLVALDAGLAICNGVPFMGHDTIKGTVVYLAGEGLPGIGVRVKARLARQERDDTLAIAEVARREGDEAARAFAASLPAYTGDNLKIMTRPFPMHFTRADKPGPDLQRAVNELTRLNTPGPDDDPDTYPYISLIIMDALANFAGELSISNDASANRITKTMHWMSQELDCCLMAVAHPTADGAKMLGAGRLFNSADFVIRVAPDDVAAPGALKTATISCQKSKDGTEFPAFGYQIEPCMWDEPVLGPDDQPTGETEPVTSATVRMIDDSKAGEGRKPEPARTAPAAPLPELRDPPARPRKRNGLKRPHGLHAVPDLPGAIPVPVEAAEHAARIAAMLDDRVTPPAPGPSGTRPLPVLSEGTPAPSVVPARGPATAKQDLARSLLAVRCPVCSRPASMGCDQRVAPEPLPLARTAAGYACIHEDRIVAAALAQPDPEGFLNQAIAALTPGSKPAPAPAPAPEPARNALDNRLWWTSVRSDARPAAAR
jgi:hypothetical protein